jgi:hypothetical protein
MQREKKADDLRYRKVTDLWPKGEMIGSLIHTCIISSKVSSDVDRKIESYVLFLSFS